jgi:hypothetical protein
MPGSSSWMPYAPQGVKGLDDDDDYYCAWRNYKSSSVQKHGDHKLFIHIACSTAIRSVTTRKKITFMLPCSRNVNLTAINT